MLTLNSLLHRMTLATNLATYVAHQQILNAGKQVVFCLEFFDSYSNLWDIAYGKYDGFIKNFANDIRNGGRQVTIRPLHEFNGDWYNWGTGRGGSNSKDAFKAAYRKVVNTFRGSGAPIRSQLSFNCAHPRNAQTSYWEWWPGSEVVDTITCSAYNRAGSDYWHQKWERFSDVYNFGYWQMNALPGGKSLGVAETSSSSGMGGNKPQWIRDAFNDLLWKFPRVNAVDWFLINSE
jgi:Glycosyl hydrolase family 26